MVTPKAKSKQKSTSKVKKKYCLNRKLVKGSTSTFNVKHCIFKYPTMRPERLIKNALTSYETIVLTEEENEKLYLKLIPIFNNLFEKCAGSFNQKHPIDKYVKETMKEEVYAYMKQIIVKFIPKEFFGDCKKNEIILLDLVKSIIYSSSYEYISWEDLLQNWKIDRVDYLSVVADEEVKISIMRSIVMWLLDNYVKFLIKTYFSIIPERKGFGIIYLKKKTEKRWITNVIKYLLRQKHILPISNVNKKRPIGKLRFWNKNEKFNSYRPILLHLKPQLKRDKLIKYIDSLIPLNQVSQTGNMYPLWKDFVANTKGMPIYGAVLDIKDAFGSVIIDDLLEILQKRMKMSSIASYRGRQYYNYIRNTIKDPVIILDRKRRFFYRTKYIRTKEEKNQKFDSLRPINYVWKHGLLQGLQISPPLCNLYRAQFDCQNLRDLVNNSQPCILHRYMDDYFFVSTNASAVLQFINIMRNLEELKTDSIKSNLPGFNNRKLVHLGYIYNMKTKQVSLHYNLPNNILEWKYRVKIWNGTDQACSKEELLFKPTHYWYYLQSLTLSSDGGYNSHRKIIYNYIKVVIIFCKRFEAKLYCIYKKKFSKHHAIIEMKSFVNKCSWVAFKRIYNHKPIDGSDKKLLNDLQLVIYEVLLRIFKSKIYKYIQLIRFINCEIDRLQLTFSDKKILHRLNRCYRYTIQKG